MKTLLIIVCILFTSNLFSQFPLNLGGTNNDLFGEFVVTADNHLLMVGYTNELHPNSGDINLQKVDLNGNVVWSNTYAQGGNKDVASRIMPTSDGNYIIHGAHTRTFASSVYTGTTNLYSATYIIKVDPSGNEIWSKSIGGSSFGDNYAMIMTENSNGEYVGYGHVQHHNGCSSYASRITKFDVNGNIMWSNCVQVDGSRGFTKLFNENNYIASNNVSGTIVFRKFNDNGTQTDQLSYQYQGQPTSVSRLISITSGEFYMLGRANGKAVIAKFDSNFNLLWENLLVSQYDAIVTNLFIEQNEIYCTGSIEVDDVNNEYDSWIVKLDLTGNYIDEYIDPTPGENVTIQYSKLHQGDLFLSGIIDVSGNGRNQYATKLDFGQLFCTNTSSNISVSSCESYTAPDGQTYTSSGQYSALIQNAQGCDSTINIDLTINFPNTGIDQIISCDSYTWIDGVTYTSSTNTPTYTLANSDGCDSTVTLDLTINSSPSSQVTQNGGLLTADQTQASYQWLDCDNDFSIITGEINQFYLPEESGNYAVEVTMNGCSDTSQCYTVDFTGLKESKLEIFSIYPNPVKDKLSVASQGTTQESIHYEIVNLFGKTVLASIVKDGDAIDVSSLSAGVYFLNAKVNDELKTIKFVKN